VRKNNRSHRLKKLSKFDYSFLIVIIVFDVLLMLFVLSIDLMNNCHFCKIFELTNNTILFFLSEFWKKVKKNQYGTRLKNSNMCGLLRLTREMKKITMMLIS